MNANAILGLVMLALMITGDTINIMSLIGVILLMGIVAKNAILLIDFVIRARREGLERNAAILRAGSDSFRTSEAIAGAMREGLADAGLPQDAIQLVPTRDRAAVGAMLGHGGIVVFDDSVDMAAQARYAMEFCAIESCGKCTPCRIGSTRGVEVIDRIAAGKNREANTVLLRDLCDTMKDASLCAMGGLTPMPVRSALKHFPEDFGEVGHDEREETR